MKSAISFIAVIVLCVFVCSGCCQEAKKNELTMWLVGSEEQARTIMDIAEEFTDRTGIKINCQAISWGDAHSKYLTSIAGGVAPDIGTMGLTWGMEFGELGAMIDLAAEFPGEVAEIGKKNFPGLIRSTIVDGRIYGVPLDLAEHIIYYRTDIVPEPPKNWNELTKLLKKLKAEGKGMIIDWGSLDWIGYAPFLWQAGGDFFSRDLSTVTVDSPEAVASLRFFASLYSEGVPRTTVPIEQGMRTGDYPIAMSGTWKIVSLTLSAPEIAGKWSIAMLPEGPAGKRTAFIGGRIMGIFKKSKLRKEAWEFIKFLYEPEAQKKLYDASLETEDSYLPPNVEAWNDLVMDEGFKKVLKDQAGDANGPPPVPGWDSCTMYVNDAIQMTVLKNADPAAALEEAAGKMREEVAKRVRK